MTAKPWGLLRRRWKIILGILAVIYGLAFFGVWLALIPLLGTLLFLAGLTVWYLPGVVFAWTGLFEYHEFGAAPLGWPGHVIMFLFYLGLATLLSLPFGRTRKKQEN